jgi:hypothetical protein
MLQCSNNLDSDLNFGFYYFALISNFEIVSVCGASFDIWISKITHYHFVRGIAFPLDRNQDSGRLPASRI